MGDIQHVEFHSMGVGNHGSYNEQEGMLEPPHDVLFAFVTQVKP